MAIVIVGGGIIGSAIAFYLTELQHIDPSSIHIVEASPELVESASGYAGGFLAKDWFSAASASLGALSFDLHAELAAKYDGPRKWGYSKSTSYSMSSSKTSRRGEDWLLSGSRASVGGVAYENKFAADEPLWLKRTDGDGLDMIGKDASAQVDPRRLTFFLLESAMKRGVKLHHPYTPTKINFLANGTDIESIEISPSSDSQGQTINISCSQIVLASGAWTPAVYKTLFPDSKVKIPISSLAGHSVVLRTDKWADSDDQHKDQHVSATGGGCHAVFTSSYLSGVGEWSPEIFSRVGGEIYIAGLNDSNLPLPKLATDRVLEPGKLAAVMQEAKRLIGVDKVSDLEVVRQGLCFRPVTNRGTPMVGQLQKHVWIASGHGPWGISLSLGTGKVVAEMLLGREVSADVLGLGL